MDEIRAFLTEDTTERLQRLGDRLARLRLELDRLGRRRGTAAEVAATTGTSWSSSASGAPRSRPPPGRFRGKR